MWECPDLFEMDGQLYIICCPQGVETQGIDYENVHQVTAMKLDYDFDTDKYEITDIKLFDKTDIILRRTNCPPLLCYHFW